MTKTAVVILNYNGAGFLRQFLPSVIQHSQGADMIVADNASTDQSREILEREFPGVRCVALDQNYGFCGGYNRALAGIHAEYLVLLNSDVEVTENWLAPMAELLDANPDIAAVQPKIRSYTTRTHFEYAGAAGGYIDSLGYPFCRGRLFESIEEDRGQYNDQQEVFWATGACMMVRASVYHNLGGLDEDFFAHMEEIDLCWRMRQAGYRTYYQGESVVYHVGGGTLAKQSPRKTYLNFRNGLYLLLKNMPVARLVWTLPVRIALDYVAAIRLLASGQRTHAQALVKAHLDVLRNARKMWFKRRPGANQYNGLYSGSIVWEYFVRGRKVIDVSSR